MAGLWFLGASDGQNALQFPPDSSALLLLASRFGARRGVSRGALRPGLLSDDALAAPRSRSGSSLSVSFGGKPEGRGTECDPFSRRLKHKLCCHSVCNFFFSFLFSFTTSIVHIFWCDLRSL